MGGCTIITTVVPKPAPDDVCVVSVDVIEDATRRMKRISSHAAGDNKDRASVELEAVICCFDVHAVHT